jgi:hypothetical protein
MMRLIRPAALLAALLAACAGQPGGAVAPPGPDQIETGPGTFGGQLAFTRPCRTPDGAPFVQGRVFAEGGRRVIGLRAARGLRLRLPLDAQGRFFGQGELRPDPLGTKMQIFEGRLAEGVVAIQARFIVPGHPGTECIAEARLPVAG